MGAVKGAVGCAVAALLLGHGLATMDADRRAALWNAARAAVGGPIPIAVALPTGHSLAPRPSPPPAAAPPPPASFGEESVPANRLGQFHTTVEIDGQRLPAMIDTGASFVALSAEDADRLGIRPMPSDFNRVVETANGRARAAEVRLASVRLGGIEVRDVTALVSGRGQLGEALLGMSFLSRLSGFRVERGRLLLAR